MTTRITVRRVLYTPPGEIAFTYPTDAKPPQTDKRYKTLRVGRRGLRRWNSFQENPAYLQTFLDCHSACPEGWSPYVTPWQRYASSERIVQDLYGLTLIHRVNVALDAAVPSQQLSIIGTPKKFSSWGTETSRLEGENETKIAPDWALIYGDPMGLGPLSDIDGYIIAWGDTKLNKPEVDLDPAALPGTVSCREAYLAQVVQYCIDWDVPFGFVLTNNELIVFHLIKNDGELERQVITRASHQGTSRLQFLPSDATEETEYSSPVQREFTHWIEFDNGDDDIPLLIREENKLESPLELTSVRERGRDGPHGAAPHQVSRISFSQDRKARHTTPEPPNSSQQSSLNPDSSPCPPGNPSREYRTPTTSSSLSSEPPTIGQQEFLPDPRADDPTHVLIKAYPANDEGVGQRLFELCMLAKEAKDNGILKIGPQKLSFAGFYA
ncbi:hypothetical protein O1611_g7186 [Lasiodiplodia mahajangana]|uniref:Uncharacterized protein n=1 Tax=Lasiodiplodia mahajangana TaxID=1108764 RepID=A0ACC2JG61_9PEZI|nr:hypothetical protein O1611_g7186 [Lasiodiplodia mahajangana]